MPTAPTDRADGPPLPSPTITGVTRETTIDEALGRLASDLRTVPGIERFGRLRLEELDRAGPRPLRAIWRVARERVDERYGKLTIGEVLDRLRGEGGSPGASAGA
jgi:nucleotidyltransferase/DNA polymerase involved in DNA repair